MRFLSCVKIFAPFFWLSFFSLFEYGNSMMPVCLWKFRHLFYMHCLLAVALHVLLAMPAANWLLRHAAPVAPDFALCDFPSLFSHFCLPRLCFIFLGFFLCESIICIALGQVWVSVCLRPLIEVYLKYVYKCQNGNYSDNVWGRTAHTHGKILWGYLGLSALLLS